MPIYDYKCSKCGLTFEAFVKINDPPILCPYCGSPEITKLITAPAFHIKEDRATPRIEKRIKEYLKEGNISGAMRFADRASSMVKSDKVHRIADRLHQKTGK
jgi:putative FmdB family regulatory protein